MMSLSVRRTLAAITVLGAGLAVASASVAASADQEQEQKPRPVRASVVGSGEFVLPYHQDKDVRSFTFDARAAPYSRPLPGIPGGLPTDARGTVKVSHYSAERDITYTSKGRVDCLVTGVRTATLTAVITEVSPGGPPNVGKRVGFSVYDGGAGTGKGRSTDRVGFSWNGVNLLPKGTTPPEEAPVGTCMAPAPYAPVTKGGYVVTHAELPSPPPSPKGSTEPAGSSPK
ncbi:hypothetical protein STAN_3811 [Streptomyces sp. CBMAI 2042]|uniref:hypothetical protein n=1 Tax=Streptomyces sp. CBMAI 2042 TaxID=2305222 RepID=UPI000F17E5C7|nr:hypothetical protein [Streptomyces sp. CBMAI 2042]RLV68287.1 hypothetical protein STAN_3811 [Streptomyces sp. CBMAI 2042]